MRENTIKFKALLKEYKLLRAYFFPNDEPFVIVPHDELGLRYEQLFKFFNPQFRDEKWKNPMDESLMSKVVVDLDDPIRTLSEN